MKTLTTAYHLKYDYGFLWQYHQVLIRFFWFARTQWVEWLNKYRRSDFAGYGQHDQESQPQQTTTQP